MQTEQIISSYILRLTQKGQHLRVGLQNVKTGKFEQFESIEFLIAHLEQLQISLEDVMNTKIEARAPPNAIKRNFR